jgi:hypothetical protein
MLLRASYYAVNYRLQLGYAELDIAVQQRITYLINYTLCVSCKLDLKPKHS